MAKFFTQSAVAMVLTNIRCEYDPGKKNRTQTVETFLSTQVLSSAQVVKSRLRKRKKLKGREL